MDGGTQRRSFTYISDGIDCLMKILENRGRRGRRRHLQHRQPRQRPLRAGARAAARRRGRRPPGLRRQARETPIVDVSSGDYYGEGYQDILTRVPSIRRAREILGWEPKVGLDEAIRLTVDFYLSKRAAALS